jgi:hypothetical protein
LSVPQALEASEDAETAGGPGNQSNSGGVGFDDAVGSRQVDSRILSPRLGGGEAGTSERGRALSPPSAQQSMRNINQFEIIELVSGEELWVAC